MSTYNKPIWMLLLDFVEMSHLRPGEPFTREEVFQWFETNYPKLKKNSIQCHLIKLSTNLPSRVHYKADPFGRDDIFYRINTNTYRLYEPGKDPAPVYTFASPDEPDSGAKGRILTSGRRRGGRISERWKVIRAFEKVSLRPVLPVRDLQAEANFYRKLGFQLHSEQPLTQSILFNGQILFTLQEVKDTDLEPVRRLLRWQFCVPHLKHFNKYLQDAQIEVEQAYTREAWGEYTLCLRSPNNYQVFFREE